MRVLVLVILLLAWSRTSLAAPVSADHARKAAQGWLRIGARPLTAGLGSKIDRAETFADNQGRPLYYVLHLDPTGFLIVSADDEIQPIIGFAATGTYDPSPDNPLAILVQKDLSARIAAVHAAAKARSTVGTPTGQVRSSDAKARWRLLAGDQEATAGTAPLAQLSSISDVRVAPMTQSQWNQGSVASGYCYNYYTPNHYACGCTATALAQVLRFYQHPTEGIGVQTCVISVNNVWQTAYTRGGDGSGGPYDWRQMPLVPGSNPTDGQRQAIGALCYDAGLAVMMQYASSGSGAWVRDCKAALVGTFGYANAVKAGDGWSDIGPPLNAMLNPNLDAGYPCLLGASNPSVGHAMVADGYGYDLSILYHHLNLGWSGNQDAWYNLPTIDTVYHTFNVVDECVYNIFVTGSGEIISGRVVDAASKAIEGVTVTARQAGGDTYTATTSATGIYAMAKVPSGSTYTLTATKEGYAFAGMAVTTGTSTDGGTSGNIWGANFTGDVDLVGDINHDGHINVGDLQVLVAAWGSDSSEGGPWNADADLNSDGFINVGDLQILVANWGRNG